MAEPTGPVRHAAVLGSPIAHSLSPVLHRAAYAALGLDWTYTAIECGEAGLAGVLAARTDWAGFSCTMPLKRAALELAGSVSPLAAAVGAANTLLPAAGGGWHADNTDVAGIVVTVRESLVHPAAVTILGAGGTAQAAVAAVAELGLDGCTVLVRDVSRTGEVRGTAEALGVRVQAAVLDPSHPALQADLVISTLPAGAADPLAGRVWRAGQALLDVVYAPWPTALAAAAAAQGVRVLSGARMLLHQAAEQVRLMTGLRPPVGAMRTALRTVRPDSGV